MPMLGSGHVSAREKFVDRINERVGRWTGPQQDQWGGILYLGSEEASYPWEAHLARVTLWGEQDEMV